MDNNYIEITLNPMVKMILVIVYPDVFRATLLKRSTVFMIGMLRRNTFLAKLGIEKLLAGLTMIMQIHKTKLGIT
ncbi:hypothetical protein CS562_13800 [Paenibacillus sp. LK1]|nr:hypothetical protein CS562_13800 [Paenibacillus sp. LK1]